METAGQGVSPRVKVQCYIGVTGGLSPPKRFYFSAPPYRLVVKTQILTKKRKMF